MSRYPSRSSPHFSSFRRRPPTVDEINAKHPMFARKTVDDEFATMPGFRFLTTTNGKVMVTLKCSPRFVYTRLQTYGKRPDFLGYQQPTGATLQLFFANQADRAEDFPALTT